MTLAPLPQEIRQMVYRTFREFGAGGDDLDDLDESVLINEGRYVARSYRTSALLAMWLIDVGILQFYDEEGNMLRTVNLLEEAGLRQMAA